MSYKAKESYGVLAENGCFSSLWGWGDPQLRWLNHACTWQSINLLETASIRHQHKKDSCQVERGAKNAIPISDSDRT